MFPSSCPQPQTAARRRLPPRLRVAPRAPRGRDAPPPTAAKRHPLPPPIETNPRQVEADESGFGRFVRRLIHFRRDHLELRRRWAFSRKPIFLDFYQLALYY